MLTVLLCLAIGIVVFFICFFIASLVNRGPETLEDNLIIGGIVATVAVVLSYILISIGVNLVTDYMLMESIGYAQVWLQRIVLWWQLFAIGAVIAGVFIALNTWLAAASVKEKMSVGYVIGTALLGLSFALVFGWLAARSWKEVFFWLNQVPFSISDPLFDRDAGWYAFSYPFLSATFWWAMLLLGATFLVAGLAYLAQTYSISKVERVGRDRWGDPIYKRIFPKEKVIEAASLHAGLLICLAAFIMSGWWQLRKAGLAISNLSHTAQVTGAGYVDHHFSTRALDFFTVMAIGLALFALIAAWRKKLEWIGWGVGIKVALMILVVIMGTLFWYIGVRPQEIYKEAPYIEWGNQWTRYAYGLGPESLETREFPAYGLTKEDIDASGDIWDSVRILDPNVVALPNFDEDEEIRNYYDFLDTDIDRYTLGDGKTYQVMHAARELPVDQVPNPTWINTHLSFTHGRGVAITQVNDFDAEGNMHYLWRGIPGQATSPKAQLFKIEHEEIYYGEASDQYIFTGTAVKEVGPPREGGGWEETEYSGTGGLPLGGGLRRLLFALRFEDVNILISNQISGQSRVHYLRNIYSRVYAIAPFFKYDPDPYLVIQPEGYQWFWTGGTWLSHFPYSDRKPIKLPSSIFSWDVYVEAGAKYLRPSIVTVVDAYNGVPKFYIIDEEDPVAQIWSKIFPGLFSPLSELTPEMRAHIRYPESIFKIQADVLKRHHMTDPEVLYNDEDLWSVAKEHAEGELKETEPRYVYTILPGESEPEFVLDWSYTRVDKENGVGFLAVRSDWDRYGEIVLYRYPIGKTITGPAQIEQLIDQKQNLANQLSWLDDPDAGRRIIRANLIVLPIRESVIYIKPIYLQSTAEERGLPQLRYVIVATTDRSQGLGFGANLQEALDNFVTGVSPIVVPPEAEEYVPSEAAPDEELRRVYDLLPQLTSEQIIDLIQRALAVLEQRQPQ